MSKSKKNSLADRLKKVFFHADGKSLNRERLVKAGSVLACVVAFTTTYALILPAVTLEGTPRCEQEEHVHTEACYAYVDTNGVIVDPAEAASQLVSGDFNADTNREGADSASSPVASIDNATAVPADAIQAGAFEELNAESVDDPADGLVDDADGDAVNGENPESVSDSELGLTADDTESAAEEPMMDPAQPVRRVLICGKEEHQHSVECYPEKSKFSPKGISPKSILTELIGYDHSQSVTVDGTTITAEYNDGVLPDDVTMQAVPVSADAYVDAVADAVGKDDTEIKTFDITFLSGEQEIEPSGEVKITFQADFIDPDTDPAIVHITDDGSADLMDTRITDDTITLKTDSFSVYAISYTVDFHGDVDGEAYEFSIPGGGFISLEKVVEIFGLADSNSTVDEASGKVIEDLETQGHTSTSVNDVVISDATKAFMENVESVVFSDPELVWVGKIDFDGTVGDLKQANGLECEYSAGLSEEEISEINQTLITNSDWGIVSLKPFDTEEILTVILKNGESFRIVTTDDIDTKKDGKKSGTVNGVDTAAEGITITMFDYGPDKLDQVNNTYNSVDNSGINKGHDLKFYSYGTNGSTINNFTGGAYAMQGVVRSTLVGGYPVTSTSSNGGDGESLAYLFDPDHLGNGATVTSRNANYLFQRDSKTGNLWYDSDKNYAYLNGDNFVLYKDTYLEEGADYANPFRIGFFPYNDYDNRYRCIHGDNFQWGCKGQNDRTVRDQVGHYNHHFGMKVEGKFYMTDDKKTENDEDMIFKFSGDDDMWVFIDGVLVLDIGGIHNPVAGYINFTDGTVHVDAVKTASGGSKYALGSNTTIAEAFEQAYPNGEKKWDDSPLSQHDIKIFYMERGGMYSNLAITMNLPTYPSVKHAKLNKIDADDAGFLGGAKFELYSDPACSHPVKIDGTDNPITVVSESGSRTVARLDGEGNVDLVKGDVWIDNLIPGKTYYLKEVEAPDGYKIDNRVFKLVAPSNDNNSNHEAEVYIIGDDGVETKIETRPPSITNKKDKYGSFNFYKMDQDSDEKLPGAQFTLFSDVDCKTVAKNGKGEPLQITTGADGKISFEQVPAGKTYYMKETETPDGYYPSSDVYRVVVAEDESVTVYKGSEQTKLFSSSDNEDSRKITNTPKNEKTSISVEKEWSDGSAKHAGDTVTVQLYDKYTDSGKTGGKISITVKADQWVDSANTQKTVDTPVTGSISYTLESKVGNGTWTQKETGGLNSSNQWKNVFQNLPDMSNGESIKYRVKVTQTSDPIEAAAPYGTTEAGKNGDELTLQGKVQVKTSSPGLNFDASKISNTGNWRVEIGQINLVKKDTGGNYNDYGTWKQSSFNLTKTDADKNVPKPSDSTSCFYKFQIGIQELKVDNNGKKLYVKVTPCYYEQPDASASTLTVFEIDSGSNKQIYVPADVESVTVEFSDSPFTGTKSIRPDKFPAPRRTVTLAATNIVEKGDVIPDGAVPVEGTSITLNEGRNGKWAHTWTGLKKTEQITEGDYTFTRTHEYYVKEVSVKLADGSSGDAILAEYKIDGNKVIIKNTVPEKTSLEVTKRWLEPGGEDDLTPAQTSIKFRVMRIVDRGTPEPYGEERTLSYDSSNHTWSTETISDLPAKVKVENELKDVVYYVIETSPATSGDMTTYYQTDDGSQYSDPADAAGNTSETIVNKNSSRKITVTKQWLYKNGKQVVVADEPPQKDVYFKLKKIVNGQEQGYFSDNNSAGVPASDVSQAGYEVCRTPAGADGTIYHLICTSTETTHASEVDPEKTYKTTSWSWNTLTFSNLPTDSKYVFVETDVNGNPLKTDKNGFQIQYTDEHGKDISVEKPLDPSIPGNYTIKNIEKVTGLYAEKIWNGVNKDNLAGHKPVGFQLMRIRIDKEGNYSGDPEEVPGAGVFELKDSEGWTKYFSNIEVAPAEQTGSTYYYWQYYAVELGVLKDDVLGSREQARKQAEENRQNYVLVLNKEDYEIIPNTSVKYQSRGGGTGRTDYKVYSEGANGIGSEQTAAQWLTDNKNIVMIETWDTNYDGSGTLGIFNSSEEYLEKSIEIEKQWKDANGNDLSTEEKAKIDEEKGGDKYSVEIQLMQRATNIRLEKDGASVEGTEPVDSEYGSTFLINKDEVVMQSDLFVVEYGNKDWSFTIPDKVRKQTADGEKEVNQLPASGPFKIGNQTYYADFSYFISEYRVYDASGKDVTTDWTSACVIGDNGYGLTLQNRKTTDLTVHKKWENVSAANKKYVDENIRGILYKVKRQIEEAAVEDVTSEIELHYQKYGLDESNVFTYLAGEGGESHHEDYIRINPTGEEGKETWWNGGGDRTSKDTSVKITGLASLQNNYVGNNTANWKKYQYWIEEAGYVDAAGNVHLLSSEPNAFLHGNSGNYPKYQSSTDGAASLADCNPVTSSSKVKLGEEGKTHLGTVNTVKGTEVTLLKTDNNANSNNRKKLDGAEFQLVRIDIDEETNQESQIFFDFDVNENVKNSVTNTTSADKVVSGTSDEGKFTIKSAEDGLTIKNLMPGKYKLMELQAPSGYILTGGAAIRFEVGVDGSVSKITPAVGDTTAMSDTMYDFEDKSGDGVKKAKLFVQNEPGAELPSTGGAGTGWFYGVGGVLALLAGSGLIRMRRRRSAVKQG